MASESRARKLATITRHLDLLADLEGPEPPHLDAYSNSSRPDRDPCLAFLGPLRRQNDDALQRRRSQIDSSISPSPYCAHGGSPAPGSLYRGRLPPAC